MLELLTIGLGVAAGMAVARIFLSKHSLVQNNEEEEIESISFKAPDWMRMHGFIIEQVEPDSYDVFMEGDLVGYLHHRGDNRWDSILLVEGSKKIQLEIGAAKKRAIIAVYSALNILKDLASSVTLGKEQSYSPRRFQWVKPKRSGEAGKKEEIFFRERYPVLKSAREISLTTGVPEDEVEKYGQIIAKARLIYGIVAKERISTFERIEERPQAEGRRRRAISAVDITKMRKSPALTRSQKKELPKVRHKKVHSFALSGPRGELGFFVAD